MPSGTPKLPRTNNQYGAKKSPERKKAFVDDLCKGGTVRTASLAAGISRVTAHEWKNDDPEFARDWYEASEEGNDRLEEEARRRAVEGSTNPIVQAGVIVAETRTFSDSLLALLLKARRPAVFNINRLELTGADRGPVKVEDMTKQELLIELQRRGLPVRRIFDDELTPLLIEHDPEGRPHTAKKK